MLTMKLTVFLTIAFVVQLNAKNYAQQITLHERNTKLEKVFHKIKKQTGYSFWYEDKLLQKSEPVNINVEQETLTATLKTIFTNQPLAYEIIGKTIVVKERTQSTKFKLAETPVITELPPPNPVKGKVTDENGKPLAGASVLIKGTQFGTTTDENGNFNLDVKEKAAILIVSYVGYEKREISINGKTEVAIALKTVVAEQQGIVVVGYGIQKRSQFIGNAAQLDGGSIEKAGVVPMLSQALVGRLPGVSIIQRSGQPGTASSINVRGVGSFGANPAPLILVDGIQTNTFNNIDPNDIETLTVLKDASSAGIYGTQAANGVILVTTKSGKTGRLRVTYNGDVSFQKVTRIPHFVPSWEYASLMNEANANTNGAGSPPVYTQAQIDSFKAGNNPYLYPNTNWFDAFFKKSSIQTQHNVSISNGSKNSQYMLSLGYMGQDGIVAKNNYSRYNVRFNLVSNLTNNLKFTTRISGYQTIDNEPLTPTVANSDMLTMIANVVRFPAIYPIYNSDGSWGLGLTNWGTPVSWLNSQSYYKEKYTTIEGNLRLDWDLFKDLKLSAIAGFTEANDRNTTFYATQQVTSTVLLAPSTLTEGYVNTTYKTLQLLANYHKKIKKHDVDVLVGHSYETNYSDALNASTNTLLTNNLVSLYLGNPANGPIINSSTGKTQSSLDSYFGRVAYNFAGKYLVQGTLRYDGSSRFGPSYKYGTFPSVAVGWRLGQENFIRNNFKWINELKLKASYGVLGNQNLPNNYAYQTNYNQSNGYVFGGTFSNGAVVGQVNDPNLHWESTRTKDASIEAMLFNGLFSFSVGYYDKYTYDIITTPSGTVSGIYGFTAGYQNSGSLNNHGWEITLDHKNKIGNFTYSIGVNLTTVKNTILDLGKGNNVLQASGYVGSGNTSRFIGQSLNSYYGYTAQGLYKDTADVVAWQALNNTKAISVSKVVHPGDIKYTDVGGINGGKKDSVVTVADQRILGNTIPKYSYGITLTAGYKNFDINILLQGVAGVSGYLNTYAGWAFYQNGNIQDWQANGRWTTANPNPNAIYPRLELIPNTYTNNTNVTSSFWLLNASYLRVKSVQLGYTLPSKIVKKAGMESVRFNISTYNLITWSHYRTGWDPELNTGGSYYPILGNFSFGLNVAF